MHRTGQMMMAEALSRLWYPEPLLIAAAPDPRLVKTYERKLLSLFMDAVSEDAPYSIHNICVTGMEWDKKIGEWLGPNTVCLCLQRLTEYYMTNHIRLFVETNCGFFVDDILASANGFDVPLVVMIPLRLGIDSIPHNFVRPLLDVFKIPQSLGILGGKANSSLYFIGQQSNDRVVYLDPHVVQDAMVGWENEKDKTDATVESPWWENAIKTARFVDSPMLMKAERITPTLTLGFLFRDEEEVKSVYEILGMITAERVCEFMSVMMKNPTKGGYKSKPFMQKSSSAECVGSDRDGVSEERPSSFGHKRGIKSAESDGDDVDEDEEFELI
eukprot:TRINITY_DN1591_c0_g1_i2.p1 TRINITY_DN1591_c0_g1~~TRINITY_DN1591_c0_g1_i2.p1  ORF type:complete len:329 (+),score=91.26 TRINITY_DN1591_c0_g1_i2:612-1598(+)